MSQENTLHYLRSEGISAEHAIADFVQMAKTDCVGLFYSPKSCRFARVDASQSTILDEQGQAIKLDPFYEFRLFQADSELRWLNQPGRLPVAVVVSEAALAAPRACWKPTNTSNYDLVIERNDYLWGSGASHHIDANSPWDNDHWSLLFDGRIGGLRVPVPRAEVQGKQDYVVIKVKEYVAQGDNDGNASVIEERLLGLASTKGAV